MSAASSEKVPAVVRDAYEAIVALTDSFAGEHLNEEYADLCRRLAAKLSRKRPSPISRGRPETWAAGIIHAVGMVNFLFDPSQEPHVRAAEIYGSFGVSESAGGGKSRTIRKMFRMYQLDPRWVLPSSVDSNPLVWLIEVDGFVLDARNLPREIQVVAHRKGLIPYVPNESGSSGSIDAEKG